MEKPSLPARLLARFVDARPHELRALWISFAYYFVVLTSYYILRPIRDEMGVAGGVDNLPWLFTGTLLTMLVTQPLFASLVARWPRRRFIPFTYHFFSLNLVLFFVLLRFAGAVNGIWIGRVFYIWAAVFNLWVTSAFWAFIVDVFGESQSKRVFGFIAAGGSVGAVLGSTITSALAVPLGPVNLLLVSAAILELAVLCVWALGRESVRVAERAAAAPRAAEAAAAAQRDTVIGGSVWAGITNVVRSPYLAGICLFMVLFTVGSTFLYFQQAAIIEHAFADRALRTAFFARVDLAVNIITLLGQLWLFARMMRWLGVTGTLAAIPLLSTIGFLGVAALPTLGMVVAFNVLRRAGNYALARPAREVLYTVLPREDKYKSKSFIDTFVYRFGDQVGAWGYTGLGALGLGIAGVSLIAAPLSALWLLTAVWLGRKQQSFPRQESHS